MKKHYYLYIDDSGSRFPDKHQNKRTDVINAFSLGGVLLAKEDKDNIKSKYKTFCEKWKISYPLHSTKIRGRRGDFSWLENGVKEHDRFMEDLESFLVDVPVLGFAVVIDRDGYNARYESKYGNDKWWMCKTAYNVLIERVSKYVISQDATFEVRFEEVGKSEDRAIEKYHKEIKTIGLPFDSSNSLKYKGLEAKDFKSVLLGEARRKKKSNMFIQIADLYLYPMIKRKYDSLYRPWTVLYQNKKVIDSIIPEESIPVLGIKYSCFDNT